MAEWFEKEGWLISEEERAADALKEERKKLKQDRPMRIGMKKIIYPDKRCSKCGKILPLSKFYKQRERFDGRRSECSECSKLRRRHFQPKPQKVNLKKVSRFVCPVCKKNLPRTAFWKHRSAPRGLDEICAACTIERNRKRRLELEGPPKVRPPKRVVKLKVCSKCGKRRRVSSFAEHRRTNDGMASVCNYCRAIEVKARAKAKATAKKAIPPKPRKWKVCKECGVKRRVEEFHKIRQNKDGLSSKCVYCLRVEYMERKLSKAAPGAVKE